MPDVIYVDTDKYFDELWIAHTLWPHAVLTGDDFNWAEKTSNGCERRGSDGVVRFASKFGYNLSSVKENWIMHNPHSRLQRRRSVGVEILSGSYSPASVAAQTYNSKGKH